MSRLKSSSGTAAKRDATRRWACGCRMNSTPASRQTRDIDNEYANTRQRGVDQTQRRAIFHAAVAMTTVSSGARPTGIPLRNSRTLPGKGSRMPPSRCFRRRGTARPGSAPCSEHQAKTCRQCQGTKQPRIDAVDVVAITSCRPQHRSQCEAG